MLQVPSFQPFEVLNLVPLIYGLPKFLNFWLLTRISLCIVFEQAGHLQICQQ